MAYAKGGAGSGKKKDEEQQATPQQAAQQAAAKYQSDGQKKTTSARNSTAAGSYTKAGSEPQQSSKASPAQPKKSYWSPSEVSSDTSAHAAAAKDRAAQAKPGSTWNPDTINAGKQSQPSPFQGSKTKAEGTANDRWQMEQSLKAQQNDDDVRIASMINGAARGDSNYRKQLAGTEYEKWIGDLERAHKEGQAVKAVVKDGKVSFESDAGEGRYYFGMDRNGNKTKTTIQSEIDANKEEVSAWLDTVTDYINGGKFSNEETAKIMGAGKRYKQAVEAGLLDDDTWADSNGSKYTTTEAIDLLTDSMWNAIDRDNGEKRYQAYMSSGETNSQTTRDLYDQAVAARDAATSEKEIKYWDERVKALDAQLKEDEKAEKRANNPALKAWDSLTGSFERPERANAEDVTTPERDELVRQYQEAVAQDQQAAGYVTDPNDPEYAKIKENRDALKNQLMEMNRSLGLGLYEGLADEDRASDMAQGWLGGRAAGVTADAGALLGGVDDYFSGFIDDTHRDLVMRQAAAAQKAAGPMGTQADWEEADRLQAEVDQYEREHRDENRTALTDASDTLLNAAQGWKTEADRQWDNALADLSEGERYAANVGRGVLDLFLDVGENAVAPGVGTARMYMAAGGDRAMEQMGRENNTQEAVATAAMLGSASAWLSEKLFGRAEAAYGKSVFGQLSDKLISRLPGGAQRIVKAATNSEPIEEGLENWLNYLGDRVLSLDPEAQMDWVQTRQESAIAYGTGLIFNLLLGDVPIDAKKMQAIADESMEAADVIANGGTKEDIKQTALETTKDMVVMDLKKAEEQAASQNAAIEGQNQNVTPAPAQTSQDIAQSQNAALEGQNQNVSAAPAQTSQDIAQSQSAALEGQDQEVQQVRTRRETAPQAETPAQETVIDILMNPNGEGGKLSNSQVKTITSDEALTQAFEEVTGQTIEGVTNSEIRNSAKDSAFDWLFEPAAEAETQQQENAVQEQETAPTVEEQAPLAERMESGQVTEDEYMELLQSEEGRQELADALGIPNSDTQSVVDGLSLYLILQNQINNQQNAETQAEVTEATEAPTEAQETSESINTQEEQGNAPEGELNTQEANETVNPLLDAVTEALGNQNVNVNQNTNTNQNSPDQKASEVSTNTLKREEGSDYRGDLTYTPESQAQLILDAYAAIGEDPGTVVSDLIKPGMWTSEQVKQGKIVRDTLYQQAAATGDYTAYDAWRKVTQEHSTPVAQSLAAMRQDPELSAERVYDEANKFLDSVENGEVKGTQEADPKVVAAARENVARITGEIAKLELEQKAAEKSGKTKKQAWVQVKDRYLRLADEINSIRHVGMILDAGKNAAILNGAEDVETNLHNLLGQQSENYIKRYVDLATLGIANDVKYQGGATLESTAKYVNGLQKLCQLATSGTTLRNLEGNTTFGMFNWASDNTAGIVMDQLIGLFTGQRSKGLNKGIFGRNERAAAKRAAQQSVLEIAANIDLLDDGGSKYGVTGSLTVNPYSTNPINRFYARAQQALSYSLNTTDAWFYGLQQAGAANGARRANRKLTDEQALAIGRQEADYSTFKNDTVFSKTLETIQAAADVIGWGGEVTKVGGVPVSRKGGFGIGTLMAPYIKVPVNIGLKAAEFSPIGAAVGAVNAARAVSASKNASSTDVDAILLQNRAASQLGRGVFGTGVLIALSALMKNADWFRNWNDEDDPKVKAQNKAEGKYGLQINLDMLRNAFQGKEGGDWSKGTRVNIDAIEPLNQVLSEASLISGWNEGITVKAIENAVITGTLDSMRDLPAISSLTTIADTMNYNPVYVEDEEGNQQEDKGATARNAIAAGLGNSLSGFVPGAVRHAARIADEYDRDTSGDTPVQQAVNQFKAAVPGLRQQLPVKTDNFGNPVETGSAGVRVANNLLANKYNNVEQSEVSKELERLRTETGVSVMPDRKGPGKVTFKDGKEKTEVKLDNADNKAWKDARGQEFESDAGILMNSQVYRDAPEEMKPELMQNLIGYATDAVKSDYAEKNDIPFDSQYEEIWELDNPISFISVNKAFNVAESGENFDAVDALMGPIRNLTKPEKDLMREKNSTLMSYYDLLTPNDWGYKAGSAQTVHDYKTGSKAHAEERGVKSASSIDKLATIKQGLMDGSMDVDDANAFFSKQASDGDYDLSKSRATIWLSAHPKTREDALKAIKAIEDADRNADGSLDEFGYRKKAQYEVSGAIKNNGYDMNVFDYIYKNK